MDFNKTFFLKKEARDPQWHLIDATDQVLGRLATDIADKLRGKDEATFTPHTDSGDYVVVINAEKVKLTGKKLDKKIYSSYSGWIGGLKELTAKQVMEKDPRRIIEAAVRGMLPKNKLSRQIFKKLKVYAGSKHPHQAHIK
ncbi:50S ribosomal protein L13 [Candidatus Babeliales bacterium]|nr:50S ribosomal protein L13 [Candidatus Babeliales bacterium]